MALIHVGIFALLCLISTILYIIILVKMFKNGGVLTGILGFIIGLYAFIWGWLKHKELKLTKIMIVWTAVTVLFFVHITFAGLNTVLNMSAALQDERTVETKKMDFNKARADKKKKTPRKKIAKKKIAKKASEKDVDWNQKAQILWKEGEYTKPDKALKHLDNFVKLNPKSPDAYNNRGVARFNLKRYKEAIEDFDKAIELNGELAMAYQNRGNAYYELNDYENALADYGRALEVNPNYALAYVNRGLVNYQTDKINNACGDFSKACELGDCDGLAWAEEEKLCQ